MNLASPLSGLTSTQRNAFVASFLGWTLDAFDFFLLVFIMKDVAREFHSEVSHVSFALLLTLAFRPLGAVLFGWAADRFGRRRPLMVNVICFSVISLLCGFARSLNELLVLRAIFGIAMGGEWGVGASLAMESVPEERRGLLSGLLQEGYPVGYLLAAVAYALVFPLLGWRGMFFLGVLPALLSAFIRSKVEESPVWVRRQTRQVATGAMAPSMGALVLRHGRLFVYLVILMTAFNFMSHGTQDIYPTFLSVQRRFAPGTVSVIAIVYNIGALLGGMFFGAISQRIGRRRAIVTAALLALPVIPLWAFSGSAVGLACGAFLMQFMVQGAWGVIPAHLSELAPNALRGTFTGFAYQVGNLLSSMNGPLQTGLAKKYGGDYARVLAGVIVIALLCVASVTALGKEARGVEFTD